jgi:hypothetical protein
MAKLWQKSLKTRKKAQLGEAEPFSNLLLSFLFFMVRPLNTRIFLKLDVKSRLSGARFEPRLNSSGISLTLNLRPTDS